MNQDMKPIDSMKDIPASVSDEEQIAFLESHGVSEAFLENTEEVSEEERPRPRTQPINVRFDAYTLGRLKVLANSRNIGYQTLLKDFVVERLYEEEKREGILSGSWAEEARTSAEATGKQESAKKRDWQDEAYKLVKEYEALFEDEDLDGITSSRAIDNATTLLLELSGEIQSASAKKGYPPQKLRRMIKGFRKLEAFCKEALEFHQNHFGELGEDLETRRQEIENKVVPLRKKAM